jgi:flagellar biosynthesis chaperone FliJ
MKDVWTVMFDKTERHAKQAQKMLIAMNARKQAAESSLSRLDALVKDYLKDMARAQEGSSRLAVTQYYQEFIGEIQYAQKGVERDMLMIDVDLQVARLSLREAEQAHMKSKKLMERQQIRSLNATTQREAKEQDLNATLRFNMQYQ